MWFLKVFGIFILSFNCATSDEREAEIVEAIPTDVNTEPAVVFDKDRAGNEPIKYDGAQLWRVAYGTQEHKNTVAELQKQFQVSMWNLQMRSLNESYVDMFVKSTMVKEAKEFLVKARLPFEVVINDIQAAINNENPSKDNTDLWQNRNGELSCFTSKCFFLMKTLEGEISRPAKFTHKNFP